MSLTEQQKREYPRIAAAHSFFETATYWAKLAFVALLVLWVCVAIIDMAMP